MQSQLAELCTIPVQFSAFDWTSAVQVQKTSIVLREAKSSLAGPTIRSLPAAAEMLISFICTRCSYYSLLVLGTDLAVCDRGRPRCYAAWSVLDNRGARFAARTGRSSMIGPCLRVCRIPL